MNHASTRILGGLLLLAVVWIGVYWMWTPRQPRISFAATPSTEESASSDNRPDYAIVVPQGEAEAGPPIVSPNAGVIPPDFHQYTVQPGDSFQSIAERFFGSGVDGSVIARANPQTDPRRLRAGRVILVPKDPKNIQGIPVVVPQPDPPVAGPVSPANPPRTYTVQRGDNLSLIAQRLLGSTRHADAIFQANRSTLSSKDALKIGQVLVIPEVSESDSR
jgi:nucleoid-associated protein YgaU